MKDLITHNGLFNWRNDVFSNVEHEMNKVFDKVFSKNFFDGIKDSGFPVADAYSSNGMFHIEFPMSGVDKENVEVSQKDGILTIKGFIEKRREDAEYHLSEWKRGVFSRKFSLPKTVIGEPEAILKDGILTISYKLKTPEIVKDEAKKITVKQE